MKKVCVSTYCEWSSYGSVLQAIGLQKELEGLGYDAFVVRDKPSPGIFIQKYFSLKNVKGIIKNIYATALKKKAKKRYYGCVDFINNNVKAIYYDSYTSMKNNPPKADYYISGSDQVWHPQLCNQAFFLEFVPEDKKRLSYAASMGVTKIPPNKEEIFRELIMKIDSVSVRETEVASAIGKYTNKEIHVNIDPTFLLEKEKWYSYMKPYPVTGPYILVYAIYWDKALNSELKRLKKETGCKIIAIKTDISYVSADINIYDADVSQFLWLINNASAVITSSFHGLAFSIIFQKKFAAVINPLAPSRLESLLDTLRINNLEIENVFDFDISCYKNVEKIIEREKEKSIQYLKEILEFDK